MPADDEVLNDKRASRYLWEQHRVKMAPGTLRWKRCQSKGVLRDWPEARPAIAWPPKPAGSHKRDLDVFARLLQRQKGAEAYMRRLEKEGDWHITSTPWGEIRSMACWVDGEQWKIDAECWVARSARRLRDRLRKKGYAAELRPEPDFRGRPGWRVWVHYNGEWRDWLSLDEAEIADLLKGRAHKP